MMHESIMLLKEQLNNVLQHNICFSLLPAVLNVYHHYSVRF